MLFDFPKPDPRNLRTFLLFYDQYAPKLWEQILAANLPASQAKSIMVRTFMSAWRYPDRQAIGENYTITWLLTLAYREGLPTSKRQPVLEP